MGIAPVKGWWMHEESGRLHLNESEFNFTDWFKCEKDDINDFYWYEAINYKKLLLAETYIFQLDNKIPVGLVSVINDKIILSSEKKLDYFPPEKATFKYYPAVKIARLGVCKNHQGHGIGTKLLNMCKKMFVCENRTGCRFMTVDAYNEEKVKGFYEKNGFEFLTDKDQRKKTRVTVHGFLKKS